MKCYWDIETTGLDPKVNRIISCSIIDDHHDEPDFFMIDSLDDKSEYKLIEEILHQLEFYDYCAGYNSHSFDLPFLATRCEILKVPTEKIFHFKSRNQWNKFQAHVIMKEVNDIDYLKLFQSKLNYDKFTSMKLEDVANKILGTGKIKFVGLPIDLYNSGDYKKLEEYNNMDVILLKQFEEKLHYIDIMDEIRKISDCSILDCYTTSKILKKFLIKNGIHDIPYEKIRSINDEQRLKNYIPNYGGYNYHNGQKLILDEPVYGIDLSSLYPNILIEFGKHWDPFISDLISDIVNKKNKADIEGDKTRRLAYKLLANAITGYLDSDTISIYYRPNVTGMITFFGRIIIRLSIEYINTFIGETLETSTDSNYFTKEVDTPIDKILKDLHNLLDYFAEHAHKYMEEIENQIKNHPGKYRQPNKEQCFDIEKNIVKSVFDKWITENHSSSPKESLIRFDLETITKCYLLADTIKHRYYIDHNDDISTNNLKVIGGPSKSKIRGEIESKVYEELIIDIFKNKKIQNLRKTIISKMSDVIDKSGKNIIELLSQKYKLGKDFTNFQNGIRKSYKASAVVESFKIMNRDIPNLGDYVYILKVNHPLKSFENNGYINKDYQNHKIDKYIALIDTDNFKIDLSDIDIEDSIEKISEKIIDIYNLFNINYEENTQSSLDRWIHV